MLLRNPQERIQLFNSALKERCKMRDVEYSDLFEGIIDRNHADSRPVSYRLALQSHGCVGDHPILVAAQQVERVETTGSVFSAKHNGTFFES